MNTKDFNRQIISLVPRIYPMVRRLLQNDEEAADAMQDILLKLWNKKRKLINHPNPNGFVFLTARNHCLDKLKIKNKHKFLVIDQDIPESTGLNDISNYERTELNEIIQKTIKSLPQKQRDVITLRDLDGLEFNEIAEITGDKVEHIRVLLSRARKKLSIELKEIYNYEKGTA